MKTSFQSLMLLLSFSLLVACNNKKTSNSSLQDKAIAVIADTVKSTNSLNIVKVSGNIEGNTTVRLGFMVAGKIANITIREGDVVKKGQLIAKLDDVNYGIAKEMADIQVNQTEDEYNRLKLMHDRNSLSESDFSKITFGLQQAKAQQKLQTENFKNTNLFSPINGVLLKKLAEPGEIVSSGMPILVISDIKTLQVNVHVPENQLHLIQINQEAKVYVGALDSTFVGKVKEVGSAADATTRSFSVKIEINNPQLLAKPGMIAEASIPTKSTMQQIQIPANAILRTPDDQTYVYVIDAESKKAFKRMIQVSNIVDDKIIVLSGLDTNEIIVSGGQNKLSNGSSVIFNQK